MKYVIGLLMSVLVFGSMAHAGPFSGAAKTLSLEDATTIRDMFIKHGYGPEFVKSLGYPAINLGYRNWFQCDLYDSGKASCGGSTLLGKRVTIPDPDATTLYSILKDYARAAGRKDTGNGVYIFFQRLDLNYNTVTGAVDVTVF